MRHIKKAQMAIEMATTTPSNGYLANFPEDSWVTIKPAEAEAIPPEIWEMEELMLIKAPRSAGVGTRVIKAEEEIIRMVTPTKSEAFKIIKTHSGVMSRLV